MVLSWSLQSGEGDTRDTGNDTADSLLTLVLIVMEENNRVLTGRDSEPA